MPPFRRRINPARAGRRCPARPPARTDSQDPLEGRLRRKGCHSAQDHSPDGGAGPRCKSNSCPDDSSSNHGRACQRFRKHEDGGAFGFSHPRYCGMAASVSHSRTACCRTLDNRIPTGRSRRRPAGWWWGAEVGSAVQHDAGSLGPRRTRLPAISELMISLGEQTAKTDDPMLFVGSSRDLHTRSTCGSRPSSSGGKDYDAVTTTPVRGDDV